MSTNFSNKLDPTDWISQTEAARIRGTTRQAISKLVRKGRLRTVTFGGRKFVNLNDVENFEPKEAGRRKANSDDEHSSPDTAND